METALDRVLGPKRARILKERFGLEDGQPRTLREVGESLGLSEQRVKQLEDDAIAKLKAPGSLVDQIRQELEKPII